MASDWYFGDEQSRDMVEALAPDLREIWDWIIQDLLSDPFPDEFRKVTLPSPPFPAGLFATWSGPFWIAYRIQNREILEIAAVEWSPDAPDAGSSLLT